jgi:DNA-binding LacI/PurR family transcriptional regulator
MSKPAKTGVTIGEVARAAGVSRATVSRVMNGRSTVTQEIASHVRAVAERLNYRPSNVARSLSLGRTNSVALVVPDLGNPLFQQLLRGLMAAADEDGCRVLVADSAEDPIAEPAIAQEARLRCDAVILAAPRMAEERLRELLPLVQPAVLINRRLPDSEVPNLWVDYADGMRSIVAHLVELGHHELVYVAGPPGSASGAARSAALEEVANQHSGLKIRTIAGGSTVADGYAIADDVLATRATAAITFNDLVAFGLLARLNESGVAVPGDISIAGFDDIELARYATPSLTTAAVPQNELGRAAWYTLRDVLEPMTDGMTGLSIPADDQSAGGPAISPQPPADVQAAGWTLVEAEVAAWNATSAGSLADPAEPGAARTGTPGVAVRGAEPEPTPTGTHADASSPTISVRFVPRLEVRESTGPVPPARRYPAPSSDTAGLSRLRSGAKVQAAWRRDPASAALEALGTPLAATCPATTCPPCTAGARTSTRSTRSPARPSPSAARSTIGITTGCRSPSPTSTGRRTGAAARSSATKVRPCCPTTAGRSAARCGSPTTVRPCASAWSGSTSTAGTN